MTTEMEDLLYFIDVAIDGMVSIVEGLGDDLANRAPDLPGANSPFAILTHCLGVTAYWGRQVISGVDVHWDRPAEFTATGSVSELVRASRQAQSRLRAEMEASSLTADAARPPGKTFGPKRSSFKVSTALVHIFEELCQHHGQMEITRDLLNRGAVRA